MATTATSTCQLINYSQSSVVSRDIICMVVLETLQPLFFLFSTLRYFLCVNRMEMERWKLPSFTFHLGECQYAFCHIWDNFLQFS